MTALPMASLHLVPRRRVILQFPPASSVWHLPAGIAQLGAVLKQDGHEVLQRYGHIIGLEQLLRYHGGGQIDLALSAVRDPKSDIRDLYSARKTFEGVSRGIETSDKFVVERNNVSYVSSYYDGTINSALGAVRDREKNLWYEYFANTELRVARDFAPDLYGISIADERQFIPGIILASMVKESVPGCLVVLGGNFWSRIKHAFESPGFAKFFDFCDAIVYQEGLQPLRDLAAKLDPRRTSGTVWRQGDEVVVNRTTETPTSFETLPTPLFNGGARQWSPDEVYSLYTASNCSMKCDFCAISAGSDTYLGHPRIMSPRRVAEHMLALGVNRFDITNEMFPIPDQIALGKELDRLGHKATWQCYLTVNHRLVNPRTCEQLYDAGCRAVQIGLETLSPKTLLQENKTWNTPKNYSTILRNLKNAGIQTHAFLIVGLPGEPQHWGLAWTAFLEEYGDDILTIKPSRYRLTRHSPEEQGGKRNEWISVAPDTKPLHLNRDFTYRHASRKKVEAVRDVLDEACRNHWAYAITSTLPWWVNRGRYSIDELRRMKEMLPPEPANPHLDKAVRKAGSIIYEELGLKTKPQTYHEVVEAVRVLI